jgi:hypothetical protein
MKINPYIFSLFLFITSIVVVMPAMPHHHHGGGIVCMADDAEDDHGHHDDCPALTVDAEPALQKIEPTQPYYTQLTILYIESLLRDLTQHEESAVHWDAAYLEPLHGTCIAHAAGLRAPPKPFLFTI